MSRFARRFLPLSLRQWGLVALASSAVALTACGGGSRAKPYQPGAVVTLGDESSAISDPVVNGSISVAGLTYAVNPLSVSITGYCIDQTDTACVAADYLTDVKEPITITSTGYFMFDPVNAYNVVTRLDKGSADSITTPGNYPAIKRTSTLTYACNGASIWNQVVAHGLRLGYRSKCSTDYDGGTNYAANGAKVADVATQVQTAIAAGKLGSGVLVTLWVGQNDLLEIYNSATYGTLDAKLTEAANRANSLASSVITLLNTGAKVVVAGVPGLEYSPALTSTGAMATSTTLAGSSTCSIGRSDSVTVLCNNAMSQLVTMFNNTLTIGNKDRGIKGLADYTFSGRQLAFVDSQALTRLYASTTGYSANARICDAAKMVSPDGTLSSSTLLNCNANTLVSTLNASATLWADDTHPGPVIQSIVGSKGYSLVTNQF